VDKLKHIRTNQEIMLGIIQFLHIPIGSEVDILPSNCIKSKELPFSQTDTERVQNQSKKRGILELIV
jgi:hypothetical protein